MVPGQQEAVIVALFFGFWSVCRFLPHNFLPLFVCFAFFWVPLFSTNPSKKPRCFAGVPIPAKFWGSHFDGGKGLPFFVQVLQTKKIFVQTPARTWTKPLAPTKNKSEAQKHPSKFWVLMFCRNNKFEKGYFPRPCFLVFLCGWASI